MYLSFTVAVCNVLDVLLFSINEKTLAFFIWKVNLCFSFFFFYNIFLYLVVVAILLICCKVRIMRFLRVKTHILIEKLTIKSCYKIK